MRLPPPTAFASRLQSRNWPSFRCYDLLLFSSADLLCVLSSVVAAVRPPLSRVHRVRSATRSVRLCNGATLNNSKPRRSYYSLVRFYWNEQIGLKLDKTPLSSLFSGFELCLPAVPRKFVVSSSFDHPLTNYIISLKISNQFLIVSLCICEVLPGFPMSFAQNHKATRQKSMNHPNQP